MQFDAGAALAALEPPTIRMPDGRVVVGRHLSALQWMRALAAYDAARVSGSMLAYANLARLVFSMVFPHPWWQVWRRSVTAELLAMPPAVWQDGLATFFASSVTGAVLTTTPTPPPTATAAPAPTDSSATSSPPTAGAPGTAPATGAPETA